MKITVTWPIAVVGAVVIAAVTVLLLKGVITIAQLHDLLIPLIGAAWLAPSPFRVSGTPDGTAKIVINGASLPPADKDKP